MTKAYFTVAVLLLTLLTIFSCKKDDDSTDTIPVRDRGEEAIPSTNEIETYLTTHFYNYEDFNNPPVDFDFKVKFDTISGDNSTKIPLMEQISFKNVKDRIDETVSYKLYYLKVIQGEGKSPNFPDIANFAYAGKYLNNETGYNVSDDFDSSVYPKRFDLTQVIPGLQEIIIEFNGSTGYVLNNDGTTTYENYGVGAAFIQSGLGYYSTPPPGIPVYSQYIFTFELVETEYGDQDFDTVPSIYEDLDGDGSVVDDDTDGDGIPNYADIDDEGDSRLTKNEVVKNEYIVNPGDDEPVLASNEVETKRVTDSETLIVTITTITFTDTDADGLPDYLDPDN